MRRQDVFLPPHLTDIPRVLTEIPWSTGDSKLFHKWLPFDKQDMMRTTTLVTKRVDLVTQTVGYKGVVYYEAV